MSGSFDQLLLKVVNQSSFQSEKGLLAISAPLKGYDDIIKIDSEPKTIDVHLRKSKLTNNYSSYIKYYQGERALDLTNDFVKDMTAVELALKL